ncbi:L,D-transpeptidase family protein [Methylobrevis albus]|uniref:Murein L,D-transpeptidase n=1 Tax=Methylobrevis albus TaxID=2793297 RepID=A0A931HYV2_9HYPH|nr:murein L,D-transpeptidase family protein [Methylobrevis albus]MBH0237272.1 murein L,D-transpeptidase [Methylobrevis albus]
MQAVQNPASTRTRAPRRGVAARLLLAAGLAALLAGCQADELGFGPQSTRQAERETRQMMSKLGMTETSPILIRIFKEENALEVWKKDRSGRYALLKSYEICKWSGKLGPKIKEGDRQAPEGYYTITPAQMNPKSSYYLSFNTGFPNAYDRANGRTGTHLMVHGACSSAGCYAMTDAQIQEIYTLARDAFRGGQKSFQLQAFPFRMTPDNLARHRNDPNMPFWKMLKEGYDHFELTRSEPKVDVCGRKYVFNATPVDGTLSPAAACPNLSVPQELQLAIAARQKADEAKTIEIAARLEAEERVAAEKAARKAEQQIMLAQREAERQERLANRQPLTESVPLLGTVLSAFVAPPEPMQLVADPVSGPNANPLPKVDPRTPAPVAVAAAPGQITPAATAPAATATIPGSTAPAPAAAAPAATTAAVSPAPAPAASPAAPTTAAAAAPIAGDTATTIAGETQPAPAASAAAEPEQGATSYVSAVTRLIPWF